MLDIKYTASMKRDMKRLKKQGKDFEELQAILDLLADEQPLPPKYRDHALTGKYKGNRECHLAPDWLFVYQIKQSELILLAIATGSHAELLGL